MQDNVTWLSHLVRRFARLNNLTPLRTDDVLIQQEEIVSTAAEYFRSRGALVFRDTGANYRGSALVTFNGLNLSKLFLNVAPVVWAYNPKTLREIAAALIAQYGAPLQASWFKDGAFDYTQMPQTVTLELLPTPFCNRSTLQVTVKRANADISTLFTQTTLVTPQVGFEPQTARTSAEFSYATDFTPSNLIEYEALLSYPSGQLTTETVYNDLPIQTLKGLIEERLGNPVAFEVTEGLSANQICFKNSTLVYNGLTSGYVHPDHLPWRPGADGWYDRVLVLSFDAATSGFQGLAYFHYNDLN